MPTPVDIQVHALYGTGSGTYTIDGWTSDPYEPGAPAPAHVSENPGLVYVDNTYSGVDSDGTLHKPFTTLDEAVLANAASKTDGLILLAGTALPYTSSELALPQTSTGRRVLSLRIRGLKGPAGKPLVQGLQFGPAAAPHLRVVGLEGLRLADCLISPLESRSIYVRRCDLIDSRVVTGASLVSLVLSQNKFERGTLPGATTLVDCDTSRYAHIARNFFDGGLRFRQLQSLEFIFNTVNELPAGAAVDMSEVAADLIEASIGLAGGYRTVTEVEAVGRYLEFSGPQQSLWDLGNLIFDVVNGGVLVEGIDYRIEGRLIRWDGMGAEGLILEDSIIRILTNESPLGRSLFIRAGFNNFTSIPSGVSVQDEERVRIFCNNTYGTPYIGPANVDGLDADPLYEVVVPPGSAGYQPLSPNIDYVTPARIGQHLRTVAPPTSSRIRFPYGPYLDIGHNEELWPVQVGDVAVKAEGDDEYGDGTLGAPLSSIEGRSEVSGITSMSIVPSPNDRLRAGSSLVGLVEGTMSFSDTNAGLSVDNTATPMPELNADMAVVRYGLRYPVPEAQVLYVDTGRPESANLGTYEDPYTTIGQALAADPLGEYTIALVGGSLFDGIPGLQLRKVIVVPREVPGNTQVIPEFEVTDTHGLKWLYTTEGSILAKPGYRLFEVKASPNPQMNRVTAWARFRMGVGTSGIRVVGALSATPGILSARVTLRREDDPYLNAFAGISPSTGTTMSGSAGVSSETGGSSAAGGIFPSSAKVPFELGVDQIEGGWSVYGAISSYSKISAPTGNHNWVLEYTVETHGVHCMTVLRDLRVFAGAITLDSLTTEYLTITDQDLVNGWKRVPGAQSLDEATTALELVGGSTLVYGVDFNLSGANIEWTGLALEALPLAAGDVLRVTYPTPAFALTPVTASKSMRVSVGVY